MEYSDSVVDLIGNTPLVRLRSLTAHLGPDAPLVADTLRFVAGGARPGLIVRDGAVVRAYEGALARYTAGQDEAARFVAVGQRPAPRQLPELAASMVVASLLLNLDEAMTHE